MRIVNERDIVEQRYVSPAGRFRSGYKEISVALGRDPDSTDANTRHPFDVEIERIPAGTSPCPYHSHSAQWEFYTVIAGHGQLRHADGVAAIGPGDAFLCKPGEPHQLSADGDCELVVMIVADNPIGESVHYPDSGKWLVRSPERRIMRSAALDYYDGEE